MQKLCSITRQSSPLDPTSNDSITWIGPSRLRRSRYFSHTPALLLGASLVLAAGCGTEPAPGERLPTAQDPQALFVLDENAAKVFKHDKVRNPNWKIGHLKGDAPGTEPDAGVPAGADGGVIAPAEPDAGLPSAADSGPSTPLPEPDAAAPPPPAADSGASTPLPEPDAAAPPPPAPDSGSQPLGNTVYYVRPGGGDATQCTGRVNADYPGSGTAQPCAFKHPFVALPPGSAPRIQGGDALVIASGAYPMGVGAAAGADKCSTAYSWDCSMPPIPSGPDAAHPTRILGQGWDQGCAQPPELYGVQRAGAVLNLRGSSNVVVECLELTDHDTCVEHHSGGIACNRSSYPYGEWSGTGLYASDSRSVTLRHLDIHGFAHTGVMAGRLTDWTLEDVRIAGNGWVGWDGDLVQSQGSSNSGTLLFRRVTIEWNGCGETYPGEQPTGCWGQTAGGYGDGLGTAATGGDWIFEDCAIRHNTSDGLDLLYHTLGGSIRVERTRAEGNAGNQLKVAGDAQIINTVAVGNCAYFEGKPFTHHVDNCRALGNTIEFAFTAGSRGELINSTLYGQGDVLVNAGPRTSCNGSEVLYGLNNVFVGDVEFHSPDHNTALFYQEGCTGLSFDADYSVIHNVKGGCPMTGPNDLCADPLLGALSGDRYDVIPLPGSPAIDTGCITEACVPGEDCEQVTRPQGGGIDRGAYEVVAP